MDKHILWNISFMSGKHKGNEMDLFFTDILPEWNMILHQTISTSPTEMAILLFSNVWWKWEQEKATKKIF